MAIISIDEQIQELNRELVQLGSVVEESIRLASQALEQQSIQKAKESVKLSIEARQKERAIEDICLRILLRYQPVASDLRIASAALKMITDMERISDQAADISRIVCDLAGQAYVKNLEHLPRMAEQAIQMVNTSIDAYIKQDNALAESVIAMDDNVDMLFRVIKDELIRMIRMDAANGEQAISLLMVAKYFERIADHAQNIAEWAMYSITGIHEREAIDDLLCGR